MKKCPYFLRKTGGYGIGLKCNLFYKGLFPVYVAGNGYLSSMEEKFDKEERDNFVKNTCHSDYKNCIYYRGENNESRTN